jgi:hypothetical protein
MIPGITPATMATLVGVLVMQLAIATPAAAGPPYDGSAPLRCAIQTVMKCSDPNACVRGTAQTANLPPVLTLDVGQRLVDGAILGRMVKIASVSRAGGRLLLQGEEMGIDGIAWDVVIVEVSGAMSGAVLSHGGGMLMFGTCSN